MGRSVICEAFLEEYLKNLSKKQGSCVGVLIGQPSSSGKDYVVYLNKIKDDSGAETEVQNILDIDNQQVSQHALIETRLLPGGFYVMGIFVINPKSVFEDQNLLRKVKTILMDIRHTFDSNPLLQGNCDGLDSGEKLVFYYSSSSNVFGCKTVALKSESLSVKPCDWKFQDRATSWQVMNTFFETDETFALKKKKQQKQSDDQYDTETNLTECVEVLKNQLDRSVVFFDGGPKDGKLLIESTLQDKKDDPFLVHVYTPLPSNSDISTRTIETFEGTLKFDGIISSKVFVHPKNTFAEVESFIKTDIVRSLMSRVQIHCDSLVQSAEDSVQDTIVLNELPRRIYFPIQLKSNLPIMFSEYLFLEEAKETAIPQIRDTLDLVVMPKDLSATVEVVAEVKEEERHDAKECETSVDEKGEGKLNMTMVGALLAAIVLLIAILVFFFMK
ncbi:protein odr-4 homolog [Aedes albopictus]|uniref:Olfactory receptor 4-like protein n=1 Tax=Aedes albopictus TaxID=7160 RepID=A0ABM1YML0_AEDAL|nr:protein odr-4 homolog [Aedes albopictus]